MVDIPTGKTAFNLLFDKNFKHAEEQLAKASLLINDSSIDEFAILFQLAEMLDSNFAKADLSPLNKELFKLLLNEDSKIGKVFWHSLAKCFSQQDTTYNPIDAEELISILMLLEKNGSKDLYQNFRDFIATNGLLRSSSKRHLEYTSITEEAGQSSLLDLVFELDFFTNFISEHKNILSDIFLFSMGINPHIGHSLKEDFFPAIKDKQKLIFLEKKGLAKKSSKESSEQYDQYMNYGKNHEIFLKKLSSSNEDNGERFAHCDFTHREELQLLSDKFAVFENLFSSMMNSVKVGDNIMYRKESFTEIFIQEMIENHTSEWNNFEENLKSVGIFVDFGTLDGFDEPFLDIQNFVETVFLVFFSYSKKLLKSLSSLIDGENVTPESACILLELRNPKTILNAVANENTILKWAEFGNKISFSYIDKLSFIEWGLEKKRKNRLPKILSLKNLSKNIELQDLTAIKNELDDVFTENLSRSDISKEDLMNKIISNKDLGQLTSDESLTLDKVFNSLDY